MNKILVLFNIVSCSFHGVTYCCGYKGFMQNNLPSNFIETHVNKNNAILNNNEFIVLFLMTKDYSAGLAMEKSGRIISAFKGNTKYIGVGKVLLDLAIERGGCKLECNDVQMLRYIYGRNGFVPVSTSPLDENDIYYSILKANEDDENHGTRLIFWIFDKGLKEKYDSNKGEVRINFSTIKEFNTEDEAEEFRDSILQNICNPTDELKEYILKIIDDYIFSSK